MNKIKHNNHERNEEKTKSDKAKSRNHFVYVIHLYFALFNLVLSSIPLPAVLCLSSHSVTWLIGLFLCFVHYFLK